MKPFSTRKFISLTLLGALLALMGISSIACNDKPRVGEYMPPKTYGVSFMDAGALDGSAYLITGVQFVTNGQVTKILAGELISSSATQLLVQAAGGIMGPVSDPNLSAAAAQVQKMKSRGASEIDMNFMMLSAYAYTGYNYVYVPVDAGVAG
jgi:hypothetical protein